MAQLRQGFTAELDQLRLQVEVMAVRVDQNLERMRDVLRTGDQALAQRAVNADDDIDAMHVSLMERCYDVLRREAPVASDLRFIVSVLRVLSELERVGDLSLRVDKVADCHDVISAEPVVFDVLLAMAEEAIDRYRSALQAWAAMDLLRATELAERSRTLDLHQERLVVELQRLTGPDAARTAMVCHTIGRSLERIADHAGVIGARLRYLLTGDPAHLAAEIR
jgi:phosphate transport system protein